LQAFILTIGGQREKFYHICIVNAIVLTACICFACFYPSVGTIIRFSGAICGFAIVFFLPCIVYLKYLKKENKLGWFAIVASLFIILLGVANVVAQFLVV
jgi:sodium-coupled neutral amino acid transporter 9